MNPNFLFLAILFVLCNAVRFVYELLKDAQKIDPENKPVFAVVLAAMLTLWVSWFILCPLDPFQVNFPGIIRWAGLALFVIGTVVAVVGLIQLKGVENINHLVTNGVFRKFRHPIYTGFLLWIVGWSVYHGAVLSFVVGIVGIANVLWWRHLEEVRLDVQFGTEYQQYRSTTWF